MNPSSFFQQIYELKRAISSLIMAMIEENIKASSENAAVDKQAQNLIRVSVLISIGVEFAKIYP